MTDEFKIKVRKISNLKILKTIEKIVNKHPELRFGQILTMLNIVENTDDPNNHIFYEESYDTYIKTEKYNGQ
jgi:hypothetical protein